MAFETQVGKAPDQAHESTPYAPTAFASFLGDVFGQKGHSVLSEVAHGGDQALAAAVGDKAKPLPQGETVAPAGKDTHLPDEVVMTAIAGYDAPHNELTDKRFSGMPGISGVKPQPEEEEYARAA